MQLNSYLIFDGQCKEAFEFYRECLGGEFAMIMTFGESPMAGDTPPEHHDRILHVRLETDGAAIMGSDAPPERYQKPAGFSVSIEVEDVERGERIFNALAAGGTVDMPLQKTFWAESFGMLVDRFGTAWMINVELTE